MGKGVCVSLVTGSMSLTATQRDSHHTAGEGHIQCVCVSVQVKGENTSVVLTIRQTPGERDRRADRHRQEEKEKERKTERNTKTDRQ